MKAKAMVWLSTWAMMAQSAPISYHTEGFVKTEVGCTVSWYFWSPVKIYWTIFQIYTIVYTVVRQDAMVWRKAAAMWDGRTGWRVRARATGWQRAVSTWSYMLHTTGLTRPQQPPKFLHAQDKNRVKFAGTSPSRVRSDLPTDPT